MFVTECPATKPLNVSYNITNDFIYISWTAPVNTYRNLTYYVIFVGDEGDPVSPNEVGVLKGNEKYTIVSKIGQYVYCVL